MRAKASVVVPSTFAVLGMNWINPVAPEYGFRAAGSNPDSKLMIAMR
jgi:hypothetical protein